jgi:hypothetical protein
MAIDIYFKLQSYPYYDPTEIEVIDSLENFLQQLEMILTTPKGSLLGDPDFGVSLDSYLWTTTTGAGVIKQDIINQVIKYVNFDEFGSIPYDIQVSFLKGEVWDTIIVDILIDGTKVAGYAVAP